MIDNLKKKNPNIRIYSVSDNKFKTYGKVLENIDVSEICSAAEKRKMTKMKKRRKTAFFFMWFVGKTVF